jgi:hypothetical protein
MSAEAREPILAFRDVAVIGGGCYGTFYARQLEKARDRGKVRYRSLLLVDRDPACQAVAMPASPDRRLVVEEWAPFLAGFLAEPPPEPGAPDDTIVPSPLMPHLMADWLRHRAEERWPDRRPELVPVTEPLRTPYDAMGPDGTRYVSFADWICPTHCVEPLLCPVIRGPRTWEMADAVSDYRAKLDRRYATVGPALFLTRHRAFGVGMFDAAEARVAAAVLEHAGNRDGSVDVLIGTISSCHGALSLLRLHEVSDRAARVGSS